MNQTRCPSFQPGHKPSSASITQLLCLSGANIRAKVATNSLVPGMMKVIVIKWTNDHGWNVE